MILTNSRKTTVEKTTDDGKRQRHFGDGPVKWTMLLLHLHNRISTGLADGGLLDLNTALMGLLGRSCPCPCILRDPCLRVGLSSGVESCCGICCLWVLRGTTCLQLILFLRHGYNNNSTVLVYETLSLALIENKKTCLNIQKSTEEIAVDPEESWYMHWAAQFGRERKRKLCSHTVCKQ